jgi:aminoglycoside 2'-N-acetyltransferase I
MVEIRTSHTADLDPSTLRATRALLYEVFDDMTESDWEHCLGGVHALAWEDGQLVGHASVVLRRLLHHGRALRTGYVEGVAVRPDRQGRGIGGALMRPLERVVREAYELGALGASDAGAKFYQRRGWQPWQGLTYALTPSGFRRTEDDDDCVHVLPVTAALDLTGTLTCDWRDGDVW